MYSPMMPMQGHGNLLPYIPKTRPSTLYPNPTRSDPDDEPLAHYLSRSSRSSKTSSTGEPSLASQDAPLESDGPAGVAGVGHHDGHTKGKDKHGKDKGKHKDKHDKHRRRSKKHGLLKDDHTHGYDLDEEGEEEHEHEHATTAAATAATDATSSPTPPHAEPLHHHRPQLPKLSPAAAVASPPSPLTPASSPKLGQQSAFKRASHSLISRAKHHDTGLAAPEPRHAHAQHPSAHAQQHHKPTSSPRFPAAQMTGAAFVSPSDTYGHRSSDALRNMSFTTDMSSGSRENLITSKPFVLRNGRSYLNDTSLPYPLPADLTELHRQSMRTLLLIQVFGSPVCSPIFSKRPPQRVLEIGCGSGFWSMMCHRYFKSRGHPNISFTGVDIAPLAPAGPAINTSSASAASSAAKPDPDMKWNFLSHDLRQLPWPMESQDYDLIMVKDMSLATTNLQHQEFVDEYIRLLRPGGVLEIWESDHLIRMLRPQVHGAKLSGDDAEHQEAANSLGAYVMNANTPISAPINNYLVEYNQWLSRALETRDLSAVPCTLIGPTLLQESEALTDVRSRRLAIPLSEVRWEREGVGGVVTKDGKPTAAAAGATTPPPRESRVLSPGQEALRQTALLTVVQQVQALEPILREVSGKSQDEWDVWMSKMMGDLMGADAVGTTWGECLEVGAWSATKRK